MLKPIVPLLVFSMFGAATDNLRQQTFLNYTNADDFHVVVKNDKGELEKVILLPKKMVAVTIGKASQLSLHENDGHAIWSASSERLLAEKTPFSVVIEKHNGQPLVREKS